MRLADGELRLVGGIKVGTIFEWLGHDECLFFVSVATPKKEADW